MGVATTLKTRGASVCLFINNLKRNKIMTPKEKAKELFEKLLLQVGTNCEYDSYCDDDECQYEKRTVCCVDLFKSKQCALIAVDEVLRIPYLLKKETWFYKEVKQEIEKL